MSTTNADRPRARVLACLIVTLSIVFLLAGPSEARRDRTRRQAAPASTGGHGDLAVIDLRAFEIGTTGSTPRYLVRALVENQSDVDLTSAWRIRLFGPKGHEVLAACGAPELPVGRVAACEIGLAGGAVVEGEPITVRLDRSEQPYDAWDGDSANDERSAVVNTIPASGQLLRIARWDVQPRIVHGMSDAQFRFSVEGAHLAWLLVSGEEPKLLAGHPADGLISGNSKFRVTRSGPVTLVARNSLGAFVYETIPVLNTYDRAGPDWKLDDEEGAHEQSAETPAAVLPPGVYDVDENHSILADITAHLAESDWASALQQLRKADERRRARPSPASALNPERLERDR